MNVAILQPSYIPWRGYFHQIYKADLFVFYDDVQYDSRGWRNRNRIKTANGVHWITIPVLAKNVRENKTAIKDIRIDWGRKWNHKHWMTIKQFYGKTPYFKNYESDLAGFYNTQYEFLADFTIALTIAISRWIGIQHTRFMRSSDLEGIKGAKTERLIHILNRVGATHYVSGPSARDYLDETLFHENRISLEYMTYDYPPYPQIYPPFDSQVSIIDLLFMVGADALNYFIHFNERKI
jgi:hypothetical protein